MFFNLVHHLFKSFHFKYLGAMVTKHTFCGASSSLLTSLGEEDMLPREPTCCGCFSMASGLFCPSKCVGGQRRNTYVFELIERPF